MLHGFMRNHTGPKNVQEDKENKRWTDRFWEGGYIYARQTKAGIFLKTLLCFLTCSQILALSSFVQWVHHLPHKIGQIKQKPWFWVISLPGF
jgi:hypothetical protein